MCHDARSGVVWHDAEMVEPGSVREATPADDDDIEAIARAHGFEDDADSAIDDRYRRFVAAHGRLVVAQDAGKVVGFGGAIDADGVRLVTDLFLLASHQGRGLGGAMLDALVGDAERRMTFSSGHRASRAQLSTDGHAAIVAPAVLVGCARQCVSAARHEVVEVAAAAVARRPAGARSPLVGAWRAAAAPPPGGPPGRLVDRGARRSRHRWLGDRRDCLPRCHTTWRCTMCCRPFQRAMRSTCAHPIDRQRERCSDELASRSSTTTSSAPPTAWTSRPRSPRFTRGWAEAGRSSGRPALD